jgi:uncharacterized protein (DUF433 family)
MSGKPGILTLANVGLGVYNSRMATPASTSQAASSSTPPLISEYIVKTPGVCSGQARVAGTRIKVKHVYVWVEQMGMSARDVVSAYPHLTMAQVHAALAYYWSHQDEIHQDIEQEEKLVDELKRSAGPSKIQARGGAEHDADDPLPSG